MIDETANPTTAAIEPKREKPKSRILPMVVILNVILLGALLYKTFGDRFSETSGLTISVVNDTPSAMIDANLEYPGGKLNLGKIIPADQIGGSVEASGEFEAVLTFKDEAGHAFREPVKIKPVGDLSLFLHILPILEKADVTAQDGKAIAVLKAATDHVRILPCFLSLNSKLW